MESLNILLPILLSTTPATYAEAFRMLFRYVTGGNLRELVEQLLLRIGGHGVPTNEQEQARVALAALFLIFRDEQIQRADALEKLASHIRLWDTLQIMATMPYPTALRTHALRYLAEHHLELLRGSTIFMAAFQDLLCDANLGVRREAGRILGAMASIAKQSAIVDDTLSMLSEFVMTRSDDLGVMMQASLALESLRPNDG